MKRQNFNHFYIAIGIFLLGMVGVLVLNPSRDMAMFSEDSQKKAVIQGQGNIGQIIIEGEVTRVQGEFVGKDFSQKKDQRYKVETPFGKVWDIQLGEKTQKIGDIILGDYVKASIGMDGTIQTVQKIERKNTNSNNSVLPRRISGKVGRMDGSFLIESQGESNKEFHLDDQSTCERNIHEASTITAQLGDAEYEIMSEEYSIETGTISN